MHAPASVERTARVRPPRKSRSLLTAPIALFFLLLSPAVSLAHSLGQSYLYLRMFDDRIDVRVEITAKDLNRALQLNLDESGRLTVDQIRPYLDRIRAYVEPRVEIAVEGRELPLRFTSVDLLQLKMADFVLLNFTTGELDYEPEALEVEYTVLLDVDVTHRNLLVIEHNWKTATFNNEGGVSLVFSPINTRQTLDLSSSSILRGLGGLIFLGTWHIWIGLDHILFLMALALPSVLVQRQEDWTPVEGFRPALMNIVAIVTCFTIAHTITLTLAALNVIRLPERFVESIIAASIAVAALHNLYPRHNVREWTIAFVFGLFHGFGFANVLADIGLEKKYLLLSLFGFNFGVELGQIAIICAVFPILYLFRNERAYMNVLKYGSMVLIALAGLWLVERLLDVSFYRYSRRTFWFAVRLFTD